MTAYGVLIAIAFLACYLGMLITAKSESTRGRIIQWGCWLLAVVLILICHLMTPDQA